MSYENLQVEKENLNVELRNPIICIAELGLWDGKRTGYKILDSNVNSIFDVMHNSEDNEFYADKHNILGTGWHHDGVNHYLFREIKDMDKIDAFLDMIYNGKEISSLTLNRYTRSIRKEVAKVYGWK